MPVTPTYPGIYIEELPSSTHTITAAPTGVAVFVGYSHPFKTDPANWGQAVEIFSFADYEREFGGFFSNAAFAAGVQAGAFGDLALAVSQFFLNGGSVAYVVAVQPKANGAALKPPQKAVGGVTFTAREVTDADHPLVVRVEAPPDPTGGPPGSYSRPYSAPGASVADVTVRYGAPPAARVETYRRVSLDPGDPVNFIGKRIGTPDNPVSALVTVSPPGGGSASYSFPTTWNLQPGHSDEQTFAPAVPAGTTIGLQVADFNAVFDDGSPLDQVPVFNLLILPGVSHPSVLSNALALCERKMAFLIMDPAPSTARNPVQQGTDARNAAPISKNAALYFPYVRSSDPVTGGDIRIPPSGTVAGIFARTDLNRGVWKAPAGLETSALNVTGVVPEGKLTDPQHGVLNGIAVNCLRDFPNAGTVVFGSRTLAYQIEQQWGYVPVRRMALFIEQTLSANLRWVVFEPNDEPLWTSIRNTIEAFMLGLFRQGAFQGRTPSQAFAVKCDSQTTTQDDIDQGIVNIVVAFAPLKPAEFVIIQIAQTAGQAQTA
jgi:phage tail sheath protein FI